MSFPQIFQQFLQDARNTSVEEYIAVVTGIASVWFSRRANILVYPTGLINTIIYVHISIRGNLFGEASVNLYYTIMSIIGWIWWAGKNQQQQHILQITFASKKEWIQHLAFFSFFYIVLFISLSYLKATFSPNAIPWADAFASATAYTGMWLMAKKKVESWYWWLATNMASIPLYFVKHYVLTSAYYLILFILAISGLMIWQQKAKHANA